MSFEYYIVEAIINGSRKKVRGILARSAKEAVNKVKRRWREYEVVVLDAYTSDLEKHLKNPKNFWDRLESGEHKLGPQRRMPPGHKSGLAFLTAQQVVRHTSEGPIWCYYHKREHRKGTKVYRECLGRGFMSNPTLTIPARSKAKLGHIFAAEKELRRAGVTFDTGYGSGKRDWELDWSLRGASLRNPDITPESQRVFVMYARDSVNWSGTPLVGGNVGGSKEERGNLTQLKRAGLITTFFDEGFTWITFTEKGRAYAKSLGFNIPRSNPTPKEDVQRRKYLLSVMKKLVQEGKMPGGYLSGAMWMNTQRLEDVVRRYSTSRNPFFESMIAGLGIGTGFAAAHLLTDRVVDRRRKRK